MVRCVFFAVVVNLAWGCSMRAEADATPGRRVVIIACEDEYDAKTTLPAFAEELKQTDRTLRVTVLIGNKEKTDIPGLDAIASADLLVIYLRRTQLPDAQLSLFKTYFNAGKPVIAIRTSSHGFQNWLEFDKGVLGARYDNHHGNKKDGSEISFVTEQAKHAVLAGIEAKQFHSPMWIYKYPQMDESCAVLMRGSFNGKTEPVTWVRTRKMENDANSAKPTGNGRVLYTALGVPEDFKNPVFVKLLTNGVQWCLEKPK